MCTVLFTVFFMIKIICILFSSIGALFLKIIDVKLLQKDKYCTTCLHIPLAHPCLYDYLLSPQFTVLHCTFYSLFVLEFVLYIYFLPIFMYILLCCDTYFALSIERTCPDLHFTTDYILFTFTFMHLADAFIQSDLQLHSGYTFSSVHVFPGNRTHNLLRNRRNALPLSHTGTQLIV